MKEPFSVNPFRWHREHAIALVLAIALGCVCGVGLGYVVSGDYFKYYIGSPRGPFAAYLLGPGNVWPYDWRSFKWGLFGAIVGGTLVYIRQLLSR